MSITAPSSGDKGTAAWGAAVANALGNGNPAQNATYVIFKVGSTYYARHGTDGTIDYSGANAATVIQAAIDALSATYGGKIQIKKGLYTITVSININRDLVTIEGEGPYLGTLLKTANNIDVFNVTHNRFEIKDLGIQITNDTPYSEAAIKISDGTEAISEGRLHNIEVYRSSALGFEGTAIELNSTSSNGVILLSLTRLNLLGGFNEQILLSADGAGANVNGIHISDVTMNTIKYGARLVEANGGVTNTNEFNHVRVTADANYETGFVVRGDRNVFLNCFQWDVPVAKKDYNIIAGANDTLIIGGQISRAVTNNGTNTEFVHVRNYKTKNSGTGTIGNGTTTSGNIAHGLVAEPTVVFAFGSTSDTEDLYCSSKDATNIVIDCAAGVVGGDRTIYWYAEV